MAITPTLAQGLDQYAVGPKLRALRTKKKLGLVELGEHTGLSAALISKIERSKMYPTLPTLLRIAQVFNVGLDHFFTQAGQTVHVVRHKDRQRFPENPKAENSTYRFESLDFTAQDRRFNSYLAEFEPAPIDDVKLHKHDGVEFLFVLEGRLGLYVENGETMLEAEDAAYFDAGQMHGYRRIGRHRCRALAVVSRQSERSDLKSAG